jgi:hypothetical protein
MKRLYIWLFVDSGSNDCPTKTFEHFLWNKPWPGMKYESYRGV